MFSQLCLLFIFKRENFALDPSDLNDHKSRVSDVINESNSYSFLLVCVIFKPMYVESPLLPLIVSITEVFYIYFLFVIISVKCGFQVLFWK